MTNLERYKYALINILKNDQTNICVMSEIIRKKNCDECPFSNKDHNNCDYSKFVNWLLEDYEEPIKLKRWEYDLLESCGERNDTFIFYDLLRKLKSRGYFKGIDEISMTIKDILSYCEVIDDD